MIKIAVRFPLRAKATEFPTYRVSFYEVDISPSSSRSLSFNYLANGQIQGDINIAGTVSKTSANTQGDNRNTRAQIWFNVQRFPSL